MKSMNQNRIGDKKMRTLKRTKEEIRYAQLWAEIELPDLERGE
jgi:hypothetical protein